MVGLAVVEFLEDVGGELGVFSDEGVKLVVGRRWGVDGGVGVSRHCSVVEDAEGVLAKGGMGLAMFEWWSFSGFVALSPLSRCWWFSGVDVVEVPRWGWKVPVEGQRVEGVVAACLVRRGSQDGGCLSL